MRKKILYIVLLTMMVLTACGKTEEKKELAKTEQTDNQGDSTESSEAKDEDSQSTADTPVVQEPSNQTESNENQSNKNETTGNNNTTTKPSTGSTGNTGSTNSGSTNNSGNTGSTTNNNGGTTTQPSTPVHEHNWVEVTEDEIHYYAWRTICGKCGEDLTDMSEDDRLLHVTIICRSRYGTVYKEVDFVTENVVKTPVITGYKCECGAEKNK